MVLSTSTAQRRRRRQIIVIGLTGPGPCWQEQLLHLPGREVREKFRIGGGRGQSSYAALCTEDGKEVQFARGINDQVMQNAEWDLTPYVGQKMFIKVVDNSIAGWGHVTVDDFQFDAKVLTESPQSL